jgi:transcriptional regulator with XRE-family HTH domain
MEQSNLAMRIRIKKLGVLIKGARLALEKEPDECAQALDIAVERYLAYEDGEKAPSLPEIELLAYYLDVPLDHFWGGESLLQAKLPAKEIDAEKLLRIRLRMIAALLQRARQDTAISTDNLAERAGISSEELEAYELGQKPIPLPVLESLSIALNISVNEFQDQRGPVGAWTTEQRAVKDFLSLHPDLQAFVIKPVNQPYLELAQRLSEMSVEKLRAVAEGLLEITL